MRLVYIYFHKVSISTKNAHFSFEAGFVRIEQKDATSQSRLGAQFVNLGENAPVHCNIA